MTTSIGVGSSAILVLEDSQGGRRGEGWTESGRRGCCSAFSRYLPPSPSSLRRRRRRRRANGQHRRGEAGGGIGKVAVPEEDEGEEEEEEKEAAGGGRERERRLLKVGGKFGSAAKLTQLSSPLLKRNFASPNALLLPQPSTRCAAPLFLRPSLPPSLSRFLACSFNPTFRPFVRRSE